jgi:heme exporter protein A
VQYGDATQASGAELRARIGVLGHDLFIYPELSAFENLTFFARAYAVRDVDRTVRSALERAGLEDRDDPAGRFSRGMRQRLALERALLHDPRLVLLDEPFTGLDDTATMALRTRLADQRAAGCIVLVATHDLETIDGVADRAVLLRGGRLISLDEGAGSLRDRYRRANRES